MKPEPNSEDVKDRKQTTIQILSLGVLVVCPTPTFPTVTPTWPTDAAWGW